jgi:hypothetical protein
VRGRSVSIRRATARLRLDPTRQAGRFLAKEIREMMDSDKDGRRVQRQVVPSTGAATVVTLESQKH